MRQKETLSKGKLSKQGWKTVLGGVSLDSSVHLPEDPLRGELPKSMQGSQLIRDTVEKFLMLN